MPTRAPFAVAAIFALAALLCTRLPAGATKVCAYAIDVGMLDKVDSKDARPGGIFRFRVRRAATLENGTSIPAGTIGYGVIRSADPAARHAHDGSLSIEPRFLLVYLGGRADRIDVTMNPTLPPVWTPTEPLLQKAASRVPLPVPGLAMSAINTVRWGRNVTLGPGFDFSVIPVGGLDHGPIC